jgi:hypothetical protein
MTFRRRFVFKTIITTAVSTAALLCAAGCSGVHMHRYSNAELQQKTVFAFPPLYDTLIAPLNDELIPIYKRIFFIKLDIAELKDKLYAGGTNQRIMRIDDRIDEMRHEMYQLQEIRREILNTIYAIYPAYETPEVVPYTGANKKYKETKKTIILITAQDEREYREAKSMDAKLSDEIEYKPLIRTAMKQYAMLPDSLKKPIQTIGSGGPVPRIPAYTPPSARRGE